MFVVTCDSGSVIVGATTKTQNITAAWSMSTTMSTGFNLDTDNNFSDFLSPNPIPPNAPTTGEDSSIIAPFLDEVLVSATNASLFENTSHYHHR